MDEESEKTPKCYDRVLIKIILILGITILANPNLPLIVVLTLYYPEAMPFISDVVLMAAPLRFIGGLIVGYVIVSLFFRIWDRSRAH